jgi:uncharacterized membrane protein YgaE (UPF0421/DUF939 family)
MRDDHHVVDRRRRSNAARSVAEVRDRSHEFGVHAVEVGRLSVRARIRRLRSRLWQIAQCSLAAATAWLVAQHLLGHPAPFFAPVAAVVSLGISFGQRLRRVGEVTIGVALGVGVGDLFVSLAGTGPWQIALVVSLSMSVAVFLDAGAIIVTQAGVQSIIVTTLLPQPDAGLSRWLDAVVGGGVALVAATLVPRAALRKPREQTAAAVRELALLLRAAAEAASTGDVEAASSTLERARETDSIIRDLSAAADEGLEVVRSSPFRRRHARSVRRISDLVQPLDRAIRNARVLVRRVVVAALHDEPIPEDHVRLVEELAAAADVIADELAADRMPVAARQPLLDVAQDSTEVERSRWLSAEVVLAQVRSIVVDLLQLTGMDIDEATAAIPLLPKDQPRLP